MLLRLLNKVQIGARDVSSDSAVSVEEQLPVPLTLMRETNRLAFSTDGIPRAKYKLRL